ncbi:MAG: type II secretion system F family protein [Eubacterium sp.]|nr:type II secretion system F family protein [Eubacterium sp.]
MILLTLITAAVLIFLYRREHLERRMLLILLALDLAGGAVSVKNLAEHRNSGLTELPMESLEAAGSISLDVETDAGEQYTIAVEAPERRIPDEKVREYLQAAAEELETLVLGRNETCDHIAYNLNLPAEVGDAPVHVEWYSDQPEVIGFDGEICPGVPAGGTDVNISAELSLQDETENWQRRIKVLPSKEETQVQAEILYESNELNRDADEEETVYRLPAEAAGRKLKWSEPESSDGNILSVLALLGGLLGFLAGREKEEKIRAAHQEELLQDYPELLSKIQLYLSTGLGMRTIFERITGEYQARRQSGFPERAAYEAVRRAVHQMKSGVTELEAYDNFGKACAIPCYRALALLLSQNLKKGGAGIMPQLEREVQESFETRKRRARAEGEKTTVKLLLPMAMMLMVVMALILIPAFLSI